MAKTALNEKMDAFFKKYEKTPITEEIFASSGFDIREVNEYGNLLHAAVNYDYNANRIMELIDILLKKGINVNYRGKNTGLTFIHLALYGYTDANGQDQSYHEDFIAKLIAKARNYGLDVNIKDGDGDDLPTCAIASEIYNGSVIKIIDALGPNYNLPDNFIEIYQKYLKEAKTTNNKNWQKRLEAELDAVTDYVNKSHLNLDELNIAIKEKEDLLAKETTDLNYEKLTKSYEIIHNLMEEMKKLLANRSVFEVDNSECENYLTSLIGLIENALNKQLESLEHNPRQDALEMIKNIATCFNLANLISRVEEIIKSYNAYLDTLREDAKDTKTLNECHSMQNQIRESEIFDELNAILESNIGNINSAIGEAKESFSEVKRLGKVSSTFIEIDDINEEQDYNDSTIEELKNIVSSNQDTIKFYQSALKDKVTNLYQQLYQSLKPLIDNDLLAQEDIANIFTSTSKPSKSPKSKEKKK